MSLSPSVAMVEASREDDNLVVLDRLDEAVRESPDHRPWPRSP